MCFGQFKNILNCFKNFLCNMWNELDGFEKMNISTLSRVKDRSILA